MDKVSFIGVGNMGAPMAANIAAAGYPLNIFDGNKVHAAEVADRIGAQCAASLEDVADCDICVLMLPTSAIVRDVLTKAEEGAFLRRAKPGSIVIDMSSSEPGETRETGRILAEKGIILIDAPVSGGMARAADGTLAIMIGSDDASALDRAMPLLERMGQKLFHVGGLGAGDAMKAANNFLAAATYAATAEAIAMGRAAGLDPETMIDIINVSTGRSFASEVLFGQNAVKGRYASGFALALLTKDVGIAARMADELGVETPITAIVADRYQKALETLPSGADNSEAIRAWYDNI